MEIYGINKNFTLKYKFHEKGKKSLLFISREKMTNMSCMFYFCSKLTSLNLFNFNTNNVINMSYMFYYCYCLKSLDLFNFNTNNVTNM